MTFEEFYDDLKKQFMEQDLSSITEHLAFQFNITGEAAGVFYVEIRDGKLAMEPYEYHDRDVEFTCKAETLIKISQGALDPIKAVALQKLKVEGNIGKAFALKNLI